MSYLQPTEKRSFAVHSGTEGHDTMKLSAELHVFPCNNTTPRQRMAILFSHSTGFHKESLHPVMRRLRDHLRSLTQYNDTEIHFVAWDARNHGDSARLNEGKFTEQYTWFDNVMDTLAVIEEFDLNEYDRFFGVGHSFGATCMMVLEFMYPGTFNGLTVIEPVMYQKIFDMELQKMFPVLSSRKRRDEWPNRQECVESLRERPFWREFHKEALENYVNYGLYDTEEGTVKLKCPREQEYHVFKISMYANVVCYRSIQTLRIPVHFIYALDSVFLAPEDVDQVHGQNPEMVTVSFIEGSHMVPNEKPHTIVPEIMKMLDKSKSSDHLGQSKL
ncbi:alpha/beta-hydrolase [Backusella circina FSU 941]|nr:alpha/beta-hydrolase [Backusella circina FSU 941]